MNYLFPIPCNYSEIVNDDYSKISIDLSTRKAIKDWVKDKLADTDINTNDKQKDVTTLAITIINSIAIAFLPKFIVLGCTVISAIAYVALARMVEDKSGTLKNTLMTQKIIEHLVDPNQKGQTLAEDLKKIECELNDLEEASLRSKKLFGEDLRPSRTQTLKDAAVKKKVDLENQLESLKNDLPSFQKNSSSLKNLADVWLKIDRNNENKITAYRDFMFYSLVGTALISIDRLKELIGKSDYTRYITYPSLIMALGMVSIAYAAKQAFSILAHRNDEASKNELLATITSQKIALSECFPSS